MKVSVGVLIWCGVVFPRGVEASYGLVDVWTCGRVDVWTCRRVDVRTCGRVDVW
jgi:hypothetical protein